MALQLPPMFPACKNLKIWFLAGLLLSSFLANTIPCWGCPQMKAVVAAHACCHEAQAQTFKNKCCSDQKVSFEMAFEQARPVLPVLIAWIIPLPTASYLDLASATSRILSLDTGPPDVPLSSQTILRL